MVAEIYIQLNWAGKLKASQGHWGKKSIMSCREEKQPWCVRCVRSTAWPGWGVLTEKQWDAHAGSERSEWREYTCITLGQFSLFCVIFSHCGTVAQVNFLNYFLLRLMFVSMYVSRSVSLLKEIKKKPYKTLTGAFTPEGSIWCFMIKKWHLQPVPYTRVNHWTYVFKRK